MLKYGFHKNMFKKFKCLYVTRSDFKKVIGYLVCIKQVFLVNFIINHSIYKYD